MISEGGGRKERRVTEDYIIHVVTAFEDRVQRGMGEDTRDTCDDVQRNGNSPK